MQVSQRPFKHERCLLKSEETLNLKSTGSIFMFQETAILFPFLFSLFYTCTSLSSNIFKAFFTIIPLPVFLYSPLQIKSLLIAHE